ncbi:hypothetical protein DRP77_11915, partial [Candidatus Poribacteria bacterium]
RGARSTFEEWYQNGSWRSGSFSGFLRSHSHAWSAYPAKFLIWNLIGFEIAEPGCRRVRVNPKETPFDYSVVCPTPLGDVRVVRRNGEVRVEAPDLMRVERA